jgi:hypothetical protein
LPALSPFGLLSDFLPLTLGTATDLVDSLEQIRQAAEQSGYSLYWLALGLAAVAVAGEVAHRQIHTRAEVPLPTDPLVLGGN